MSDYGLTHRSTMCHVKFTASKFVAISVFMKKLIFFSFFSAFSLEIVLFAKTIIQSHAITPPKQMQTLLFN